MKNEPLNCISEYVQAHGNTQLSEFMEIEGIDAEMAGLEKLAGELNERLAPFLLQPTPETARVEGDKKADVPMLTERLGLIRIKLVNIRSMFGDILSRAV